MRYRRSLHLDGAERFHSNAALLDFRTADFEEGNFSEGVSIGKDEFVADFDAELSLHFLSELDIHHLCPGSLARIGDGMGALRRRGETQQVYTRRQVELQFAECAGLH